MSTELDKILADKARRITTAQQRLDELKAANVEQEQRLNLLRTECVTAERRLSEMTTRAQSLAELDEAFARIEDVLRGRITHIVCVDEYGRITVQPTNDALKQADRYYADLRMLGFFGKCRRGTVDVTPSWWAVNEYSDGSGKWTSARLARSEEEARAEALKAADAYMEQSRPGYYATALVASLDSLNLPVRDEWRAFTREYQRESAQEELKHATKDLERAQAKVAQLKERAGL